MGIGRRLAVAVLATVALAAVLVQVSEATSGDMLARDGRPSATVVATPAQAGGLSLVTGGRAGGEAELASVVRFSKAELTGAAWGLGLPALGWGWWYLLRSDRRLASPSRRPAGAALRAPPRLALS